MPALSIARSPARLLALLGAIVLATSVARSATPRFLPDDPLTEEPETQDASGVQPRALGLLHEIATNLFSAPGDPAPASRALNVNTIDEVPDSSWFTNRAGVSQPSPADVARGPDETEGPASGTWTVIAAKLEGITPGFAIRDAAGLVWYLKFDPPGYGEMATGAEVTATKLFWALGYNVPENHIARLDPSALVIDPQATVQPVGFRERAMRTDDIGRLLRHAEQDADGTYRVVASRRLPGRPLGGFRFYGTRPDDPNDVIPHEHRRELRAFGVAAAWLNHVDAKSINTLDTLVTEDGRVRVRHYLLDFGSTLGSAAVSPRRYFEGFEYMVEPDRIRRRALTLGFAIEPWRTLDMYESPALGRLPRDPAAFDPDAWRPTVPNAARRRARADDRFWIARRIAALTDGHLRAAVGAGGYARAEDAAFLVRTLAERRDAIARAYLPAVNPIVDPVLDEQGRLTFRNAAVDAGVAAPPRAYTALWSRLDNANAGGDRELGRSEGGTTLQSPVPLPVDGDVLVGVSIAAVDPPVDAWAHPVRIAFRRQDGVWRLVGLDRGPL